MLVEPALRLNDLERISARRQHLRKQCVRIERDRREQLAQFLVAEAVGLRRRLLGLRRGRGRRLSSGGRRPERGRRSGRSGVGDCGAAGVAGAEASRRSGRRASCVLRFCEVRADHERGGESDREKALCPSQTTVHRQQHGSLPLDLVERGGKTTFTLT